MVAIADTQTVAIRELVDTALENKDLAPLVSCTCMKALQLCERSVLNTKVHRCATSLKELQSRLQMRLLLLLKQTPLAKMSMHQMKATCMWQRHQHSQS